VKKKDKILIQNKIDGELNPQEEIEFSQLIKQSNDALNYYHKLFKLSSILNSDADKVAAIDFSKGIMQSIKNKQANSSTHLKPTIKLSFVRNKLMTYAAILLIGLVVGSLLTYNFTNSNSIENNVLLSGTIGKIPETENSIYSDKNTKIKLRELENENYSLFIFSIQTTDTITCTIVDQFNVILSEAVILLSKTDDTFFNIESEMPLKYSIQGTTSFQINAKNKKNVSIKFSGKKKLLKQVELE
jgi:hypothetical protein